MKTIQEWLKEVDKEELIGTYIYNYPINIFDLGKKTEKYTVEEVKRKERRMIEEYIDRLINLEIETSDIKNSYVVFAYKTFINDSEGVDFSIIYTKEILEKEITDDTIITCYSCILDEQKEIMGHLVADTNLTERNIYGLLAFILHEASWFGFSNEHLEEEREKLEQSMKDIEEGNCKTFSIEEVEKELGIIPEEKDEVAEELYRKVLRKISDFHLYGLRREARKVKENVVNELASLLDKKINKLENELEHINKDLNLTISIFEEEMEENE